jgi:chemosensory pili system protein ChpA (sensor histidine kinase/response regulator)
MSPTNRPPQTAGAHVAVNDLGPLAWVLDELRKSLDTATKALKRYVRDAEQAKGSDLAAVDASQLRLSRQQLHQAVGALEMVGFAEPATILRAMEAAVQKFVNRPELCDEAAANKVERAGFALVGYLEAVLSGKAASAVTLFVPYAEVQELAGATRVHPADLWSYPWRWQEVAGVVRVQALALDATTRGAFDKHALTFIKSGDLEACAKLADISSAIAKPAGQNASREFKLFWRITAAFFESLAHKALASDTYVKRTVSRILVQLATHMKGDLNVSDRLAQDLIFFCAQAQAHELTPRLEAVREAYALHKHVAIDYSQTLYGHFDPALLVQARKRISAAKESWSALTAGETSKLRAVSDQFALIADSINKLVPQEQRLSQALMGVSEMLTRQNQAPDPSLGMEVATAILYLEAGFEEFDPADQQLGERVQRLAARVEQAKDGAGSQPLEPWMEELYRRVSDRQTLGSVVGELKLTLGELEKSMDAYFRDPQDKVLLADVPARLTQMRGVLSVLGMDQASVAVMKMRDSIEQLMVTEVDEARAREAGTFDKLGNNLGALGFMIDMLSYQPVLAKKLFVYDDAVGELKPLMGRVDDDEVEEDFVVPEGALSDLAPLDLPSSRPAPLHVSAAAPLLSAAATTPAAPVIVDSEDVDPELLDIFLEEAREVVGNGTTAIDALIAEPNNIGEMTTLRRAFHTLKGSSRMVGLNVFGEAAWSMEQVLNTWLAEQKPANDSLTSLAGQSMQALGQWVEAIAAKQAQSWSAEPFRRSADALRSHGVYEPLALGGGALAAAASSLTVAATEAPSVLAVDDVLMPADVGMTQPAAHAQIEPVTPVISLDSLHQAGHMELQDPGVQASSAVHPDVQAFSEDISFDDLLLDDAQAQEVSGELSPEQSGFGEVEQLPDLINADELAAFERAMMELERAEDGASAADAVLPMTSFEVAPSPVSHDAITAPQASGFGRVEMDATPAVPDVANPVSIEDIDLQALQALSSASTPVRSAPVEAPTEIATRLVTDEPSGGMNILGPEMGLDLSGFDSPANVSSRASRSDAIHDENDEARESGGFDAPSGLMGLLPSMEEQFKAIGPLRISLPLYNVYLNEADEWSRRLAIAIEEWSMEPGAAVPSDAVAYAHSLAGSSATVGFTGLSALARTFEHALQHIQRLQEDSGYDALVHAQTFIDTTEEVRRLLHQFAAGFLKEPSEEVSRALERCLQAPDGLTAHASLPADLAHAMRDDTGASATLTSSGVSGFVDLSEPDATHAEPPTDPQLSAPVPLVTIEPPLPPAVSQASTVTVIAAAAGAAIGMTVDSGFASLSPLTPVSELTPLPEPEAHQTRSSSFVNLDEEPALPVASAVEAPVRAVVQRTLTIEETEDEIDAVDNIDPDLFEIFEDEAVELFPQMSAALRQWHARPENGSARTELLRGLHTLKGSARMAGVLRLGEMAHRMESSVEQIPTEGASEVQIEPLQALLDGLHHNFEKLRNPSLQDAPTASSPVAAPATAGLAVDASSVSKASSGLSAAAAAALPGFRPMTSATPVGGGAVAAPGLMRTAAGHTVRVRAQLLDRLMNQAGEVMITRTRLETELNQLRGSLSELTGNLDKLRTQLRELDVQAESQMQTRIAQAKETDEAFDPLEFDRYTRVQELTRMMAESVNDVATVQRNIQRAVEATEDDLVAQARQTRDLQRDLLRTRMVEFEGISERLYRVVRQAAKDSGKQVKLDIIGGSIEMDRGVLERMAPAFEHLLRNCVAHGIEDAEQRTHGGKDASGQIIINLHQEGNDVSVEFRDDGAGLNIARIREKALSQGLITNEQGLADDEAANLIFTPGFTTAAQVTELSGRGIGMDVVRSEVLALGGRIETATTSGKGTSFKLVLPLTTAVTQVVMIRVGNLAIGVPANLIEIVRRATPKELQAAYNMGSYEFAGENLSFFWAGALLQHSRASAETPGKSIPVVVFRSAAQRIAVHVDEVLGNQEVVVKNLGPQLSRLPGLAGMTVMASGAVALIYNPVALAAVYGEQARAMTADKAQPHVLEEGAVTEIKDVTDVVHREISEAQPVVPLVPANPMSVSAPQPPLVLVVDDSITVRRVTQRLLQREGYRVAMAADGLQALERLAEELPAVVLSDIEMPRMDGFDLARNIKADDKLKHLPIIMITSRIAEKHREHAAQLGVQHYLGKPYAEEELLSLIGRYAREEVNAG